MKRSENTSDLMPALFKAKQEIGAAVKSAKNPYFKSKYADLNSVIDACEDILHNNGLLILQPHEIALSPTSAGVHETLILETFIFHAESSEYVCSATKLQIPKLDDPQAMGSAITYARRYALMSLLGMKTEEDDDGENAKGRGTSKKADTFKKKAKKKSFRKKDVESASPAPEGDDDEI